ncbi:MarR family transcriptional regulator [Tessaracoccus terricola]
MAETDPTRWLSPAEHQTWLAVWGLMTWLPARLDTQLRQDSDTSLAEYNALSQISMAPGRSMRLGELALVTNMTQSHLSRVMTRLENAGWVRREPDPTDGRVTLGILTEAGWARVREIAPGHVEAVRRAVFDNLTPEQAEALGVAAAHVVAAVSPAGLPARG